MAKKFIKTTRHKIKVKTEEMYQDFLKFMNDNNK